MDYRYGYTPKIDGDQYEPGATIEIDADTATLRVESNEMIEGVFADGVWHQAKRVNGHGEIVLPKGKYWKVIPVHAGGLHGCQTSFTLVKRETPAPAPSKAIGPVTTNGATISDLTIETARWGNNAAIGINPIGSDITIRNIVFTGDGGYLIKVNGPRCKIENVVATTFNAYAVFAEGAKDLVIRNMHVIGGSRNPGGGQAESIIRFADCENVVVEDSVFDYRPVPPADRKATCRGNIRNGRFARCKFYGAVVGNTCMTGFDAGEGYIAGGMLRIIREPWIVTLDNAAEWEAAVKQIVSEGVSDQAAILNEAMKRVTMRIKGGVLSPSHVDVERTVKARAERINQRSDVVYEACHFDAPVRNSAGTAKVFNACTFAGEVFAGWNEPTYPSARFALPGDVPRPAPQTLLNRCVITSDTVTKAGFEAFCKRENVRVSTCTFNGETLANTIATS